MTTTILNKFPPEVIYFDTELTGDTTAESLDVSGPLKSVTAQTTGTATFTYTSNTAGSTSTKASSFQQASITGDGSTTAALTGYFSAPYIVATSTGGTANTNAVGMQGNPFVYSADAGARISAVGGNFTATRASSSDVSSNANNAITGVNAAATMGATLPSTAYTGTLRGSSSTVIAASGNAGAVVGSWNTVNIGTDPAGNASTVTDVYLFRGSATIGSAKAANITNFYGLYLPTFTQTFGTTTNRYGAYQADPLATNVFLGPINAPQLKVRARTLNAVNSTATLTVPSTPTAVPFTTVLNNDPQFTVADGVITFAEDCHFNSVFFANLSNVGGPTNVLSFYCDAETSTDGVTWTRGSFSLRQETVRGSDNNASRNFPYAGKFLAGQRLRFVWWSNSTNCRATTDTVSGSTAPAIRLMYNSIPATFIEA